MAHSFFLDSAWNAEERGFRGGFSWLWRLDRGSLGGSRVLRCTYLLETARICAELHGAFRGLGCLCTLPLRWSSLLLLSFFWCLCWNRLCLCWACLRARDYRHLREECRCTPNPEDAFLPSWHPLSEHRTLRARSSHTYQCKSPALSFLQNFFPRNAYAIE